MTQTEFLQRFIIDARHVRGAWVRLDTSLNKLYKHQREYQPQLAELLNQSLAASLLLSAMLKIEGRISLQGRGDGPLSWFSAETLNTANQDTRLIRGILRETEDASQRIAALNATPNFKHLLGSGQLSVTIEPSQEHSQRYQSLIALEEDELAANLSRYFLQSEQLESVFVLASDANQSCGLMLQKIPPQDEHNPQSRQAAHSDWEHCLALVQTLAREELMSTDCATLLYRLFHEETVHLFDSQALDFHCGCSRARTAAALKNIGQDEALSIFRERGSIDMQCEFCGINYHFDIPALSALFEHDFAATLN